MKTEWDYTNLANAYLTRPSYSEVAIGRMLNFAGIKSGDQVGDIGAGVGHLTLSLSEKGLQVMAVEPNNAMRKLGMMRTNDYKNIEWFEGTGENTNFDSKTFDMITFGSSFNVCNRDEALNEAARILKPRGWFACMWNHRQLDDSIQNAIEKIIQQTVKNYGYGVRRESQTSIIKANGLYTTAKHFSNEIIHQQTIEECITCWQSHATLQRQAGKDFDCVIEKIGSYLHSLGVPKISVPYRTNIWMAQLK